jgi:F-type H+-transporting ATPase subunit b
VDAKLNARIAEAEKIIAATRSAAMANVRGIASDTAPAIVERLIGIAPTSKEVAEAVGNVLKR